MSKPYRFTRIEDFKGPDERGKTPQPEESPYAGSYGHSLRAPPSNPIHPRTGRPGAYSSVLKAYRESFNSIPVREEGLSGGLWDEEREAPRRGPPRPERYDAEAMRAWVAVHSASLTGHELLVHSMFWGKGMSYLEVAKELGTTRERIYECIKRLRVKLATKGVPHPNPSGARAKGG